ncbi:MAG: glycosyltransferase family 4 protein [bacterium]|jgi:glycosyltransferase involved in cell wall biosynthesis
MIAATPSSPPAGPAVRAERPLRIAYVTETYPPDINGVATTVACMVEGLRARGHVVQLVRPLPTSAGAAARPVHPDEVLLGSLPVPFYPGLRMGTPCRGRLRALWTRQAPDVVHIATEGPLGWSALAAARSLGLPATSDFRTNFHAYSPHYGIGWLHGAIEAYLRHFHNRTLQTMVPTEALRRDLAAQGFRGLTVVARGVDTVRFDPAHRSDALRARWGAAADDPVVLSVGRLAPEKNLETLLDAFDAIRVRVPGARLVVVGDGQLHARIRERCPDAVMSGERVGHELATHYASADLFLFPSLTETYGNVTAEAMASGLPVVAFDYAAAAKLIRSGENGLLVPFEETAVFIEDAAVLAGDRSRARAIGRRARATACACGWDAVVERLESVLASFARPAGGRPDEELGKVRRAA